MTTPQKRKLLIIGCARSGTTYTHKAWKECGLKLGHEFVDEGGSATHWFAVDATWHSKWTDKKAHVGERRSDYEFEHIWHQVRAPLVTITSNFFTMTSDHRKWLHEQFPGDFHPGLSKLYFAMAYYYRWNMACEAYAQRTYRVEDLDELWGRMTKELLGEEKAMPELNRQMNRQMRWGKPFVDKVAIKAAPDFTWEQLEAEDLILATRIRELASRYSYP